MAKLVLKYNICQKKDCTSLFFSETTGTYNSLSNSGGFGSPNPVVGDATSVLLKVLFPNADDTVDIDISASFPTVDSTVETEITSEDLGLAAGAVLADGIYEITYEVIANGVTYTETKNIFLYCNVQCCINQFIATIPDTACNCTDSSVSDALTAFMLMRSLEYAAVCGKKTKFTNTLAILNNICTNNDCGCS